MYVSKAKFKNGDIVLNMQYLGCRKFKSYIVIINLNQLSALIKSRLQQTFLLFYIQFILII